MKNYYTKILFFVAFSLSLQSGHSQNVKQIKQITSHYDLAKIEKLKSELKQLADSEKAAAYSAAEKYGWEIYRKNKDGSFDELMGLFPDGKPLYYSLDNVNAAKSTRANHLNTGGTLGLQLDGQGMFSGVWDGGAVRTTHQEFGGRMVQSDGATVLNDNSFHATHVTGTVAASGFQPNAKGMAPLSTVKTFDWNNDVSEALEQAKNGLLLSNHSYGIPLENIPGNWYPGAYSAPAKIWDQVLYAAPYYLMVASAGNDGSNNNPAPSSPGYDKLTGNKVAKNNLVVANCADANVDSQGNLISVFINSSSSEGPADDSRIKPDITGNGTGLYSSFSGNDADYGSISGTSMASPNVMGTLILLQQHYNITNNTFMRAATLKGLACHTADDKGRVGPDAIWGWGLLNAKRAAQAISNNGLQSWISEETLSQDQTFTFTAQSDGTTPLLASITWTDVPGIARTSGVNNTTPALVNDLDIRITKDGNTFFPWKLQALANQNAINTGDNSVDNVERINIASPEAGIYTITVTHKGTLQEGPQNFSFIVTGMSSVFGLTSLSDQQNVCLSGNATFNFNYNSTSTASTTFTASGLPQGALATFTSASLNSSGLFSVTLSNLQNATAGIYPISITGNNGVESETRVIYLKVLTADFANVEQVAPASNQDAVSTDVSLNWNPIPDAESFHVQVATDVAFSNIITDQITVNTTFSLNGLAQDTNYFWRVFPANVCGEGINATISNFKTGVLVCNEHFEPTDYSNAIINEQFSGLAVIQIPVDGGFTIGDLNVSLDITHTSIQDLTVELEGPFELGFPKITLLAEPCGNNQNINASLDDSGIALICNTTIPAISGTFKPVEPLNTFNNKIADGVWTLYVRDPHAGNGGMVNLVALNFCTVQSSLSTVNNTLTNFSVFPNPSKGILNVKLGDTSGETALELFDIQGRSILTKKANSSVETLNIGNLQNGVYFLSLTNGNQKAVRKIVLSK